MNLQRQIKRVFKFQVPIPDKLKKVIFERAKREGFQYCERAWVVRYLEQRLLK